MFTLTWITEKELERVIENKKDEFCRKKNMKIQSSGETIGPFIQGKIRHISSKIRRGLAKTRLILEQPITPVLR